MFRQQVAVLRFDAQELGLSRGRMYAFSAQVVLPARDVTPESGVLALGSGHKIRLGRNS
jgi:hypothetical protein